MFMLQRQFRLPARQRLLQAKIYSTSSFVCKIASNSLPLSRFGFIISKTVDKRAVVRNRTRRVLRSIIEDSFSQIRTGFDLLFILRRPIEKRNLELDDEVKLILKKAGLLQQ